MGGSTVTLIASLSEKHCPDDALRLNQTDAVSDEGWNTDPSVAPVMSVQVLLSDDDDHC